METTWAPWRMQYVAGPKEPGCIFCNALADPEHERERLLLYRDPHAFVMLNRFPYNNGHLLVSPTRHVGDPGALSAPEFAHLAELLRRAVGIVQESYSPEGANLGMNLGHCAGAGVPGHLHWHVVPRWSGDTNFMPVLADTRCIVEHLEATWERLRPLFDALRATLPAPDAGALGS